MKNWKESLKEQLPLLGHRNWIVITDMAYPLQSNPGIVTLYAPEAYQDVVRDVNQLVQEAPHVRPNIYLDEEQKKMSEGLCEGWDAYRKNLADALQLEDVKYILHEDLIARLDEVSKVFNVVIIKTPLTIPYSSVFFELNCGYWGDANEKELRK